MRPACLVPLVLVLVSCGGGAESPAGPPTPPPPPPAPVASIVLDRDTATLVPRQGRQLTPTLRDAAGNTLSGRVVSWTSSAGAATVSAEGLVTGVSEGSTTITATSEGRSATATVTVRHGALVDAAGGLVASLDSSAIVVIPAGALSSEDAVSMSRESTPLAHARLVTGTSWTFGPSRTWGQPLTIRLRYPATPAGMTPDTSRYRIHRIENGTWTEVLGGSVDVTTRTATARTSALGTFAIVELLPLPIASLTLSRDTATLVPAATLQLSATPRDSAGNPLAHRAITWSSDAPAIATVSSSGLVTALTPGTAQLSAASEGLTQRATITVVAGGYVTAGGGSARSADGAARVVFPAGALTTAQSIVITPVTVPTPSPFLAPGTAYEFGPSQTFAAPVAMTIGYVKELLPPGMSATSLRLHRLTAGSWVVVPGSVVDTAARTVTGPTSSFSTYALLGSPPVQQYVATLEELIGWSCNHTSGCGVGNGGAWTVPADVYTVTVELFGAGGGGPLGPGMGAGKGGKVTATLDVVPGEMLQLRVGGTMHGHAAGGNGGGGGGFGASNGVLNQGAWCLTPWLTRTGCPLKGNGYPGGGATDIRRTGLMLPPNTVGGCFLIVYAGYCSQFPGAPGRLAVAGGGGGDGGVSVFWAGGTSKSTTVIPGGSGGHGGGHTGAAGVAGGAGASQSSAGGGTGGSQLAPGRGGAGAVLVGGSYTAPAGDDATALWGGGRGGIEDGSGGGGGGGGWFGGGGGGSARYLYDGAPGGGGGGGSSYGPPGAVLLQGVHQGGGKAVITFTPSPGLVPTNVTATLSSTTIRVGQSFSVNATVALSPPAPPATVSGSVRFSADGSMVGGGVNPLVNSSATLTYPPFTTTGKHLVTVTYLGNGNLAPSAVTVEVTVQP